MSDAGVEAARQFFRQCPPPDAQWYVDETLVPILAGIISAHTEAAVNAEAAKHADCCVDREEIARLHAEIARLQTEAELMPAVLAEKYQEGREDGIAWLQKSLDKA